MSFTAKELEEALMKVKTADRDFPDYPVRNDLEEDYRMWSEENFPMTLTQVGEEKNVTVYCKDFFGGEEGGDHAMYIILSTGSTYSNTDRYFEKTGEYNSWDSSYWDGGFTEVVQEKIEKTIWVNKK